MAKQPSRQRKAAKEPVPQKRQARPKAARRSRRSARQKYGTSKLETYFATEFLDKLGIDYVYEYEARQIGRFYDFAIVRVMPGSPRIMVEENGIRGLDQVKCYYRILALVEINGGYYHGDPRLVAEEKMNRMQRHNRFVDTLKEAWCTRNSIPLLTFWEEDIRKDPKTVTESLKSFLQAFAAEEERKKRISGPHLCY